jgi:hypothetical protein
MPIAESTFFRVLHGAFGTEREPLNTGRNSPRSSQVEPAFLMGSAIQRRTGTGNSANHTDSLRFVKASTPYAESSVLFQERNREVTSIPRAARPPSMLPAARLPRRLKPAGPLGRGRRWSWAVHPGLQWSGRAVSWSGRLQLRGDQRLSCCVSQRYHGLQPNSQ